MNDNPKGSHWLDFTALLAIVTALLYLCGYNYYLALLGYFGFSLSFGEVGITQLLFTGGSFLLTRQKNIEI